MKTKDKPYQFLKLCIALTKQGFRFTRYKDVNNDYLLIFENVEYKRLFSPYVRLPFVNYVGIVKSSKSKIVLNFGQWSDNYLS